LLLRRKSDKKKRGNAVKKSETHLEGEERKHENNDHFSFLSTEYLDGY
jgi:hypothetical protein